MRSLLVASAPLLAPLFCAAVAGCSANAEPVAIPTRTHAAAWVPPPALPCEVPSGHVVEHWREAPAAGIVAIKTLDASARPAIFYRTLACEPLEASAAEARQERSAIAMREAQVSGLETERVGVHVWVGSRREREVPLDPSGVEAERDARAESIPRDLRRRLVSLAGSYAFVGEVTKAEALALAHHAAVRAFFAYAPPAPPAAADVAKVYALEESDPAHGDGLAVFDDCATPESGVLASSFASAAQVECLTSEHGSRVARLAFDGLAAATPRWTAGLTARTTDAPESLAAPALWALARRHAGVMVQTLHTTAGDGANDALDLLIAEAAYPDALVVRAAGNGLPSERVVHRVLGALDVGGIGVESAPLLSMRTANAATRFGDVERPALLADGIVVDAEGGAEGTSFAAPRVARLAVGLAPSTRPGYSPLLRRAKILAAAQNPSDGAPAAVRMQLDAVAGAGPVSAADVGAAGDGVGVAEGVGVGLGAGMSEARTLVVPFEAGKPMRATFALVFEAQEGGTLFDHTRAPADLDLRVTDGAGTTIEASQSFDDDQEVVSLRVVGGQTLRFSVEQASAQGARRAVVAWRFRAEAAAQR